MYQKPPFLKHVIVPVSFEKGPSERRCKTHIKIYVSKVGVLEVMKPDTIAQEGIAKPKAGLRFGYRWFSH
jgi:hypothetical protein